MSVFLSSDEFLSVVRSAPLISMDLLVSDLDGMVLLGRRRNAPARYFWFVPGGRIRKNETLASAFHRITLDELGSAFLIGGSSFFGFYEHFYDDNFANVPGIGTHYVVLAFSLCVDRKLLVLPEAQHQDYRWVTPDAARNGLEIHANTRAYFMNAGGPPDNVLT